MMLKGLWRDKDKGQVVVRHVIASIKKKKIVIRCGFIATLKEFHGLSWRKSYKPLMTSQDLVSKPTMDKVDRQ